MGLRQFDNLNSDEAHFLRKAKMVHPIWKAIGPPIVHCTLKDDWLSWHKPEFPLDLISMARIDDFFDDGRLGWRKSDQRFQHKNLLELIAKVDYLNEF